MMYNLLNKIDQLVSFDTVSAHCDIPCKIYDPIAAQISALSVIRMIQLINELTAKGSLTPTEQSSLARLVGEKENEGRNVKREITVILGDYIKQPQLDQFPELHELSHGIMLAASKAKQHIDMDFALDLLAKVNRFADIFWQTKGVETFEAKCPYPPNLDIVYPKLS